MDNIAAITNDHVILPKLFRRLVEYLQSGGPVVGFKEFLEARAENILIISEAHYTHFDTVVKVEANTMQMTELSENLIFMT